MRAEGMPNLKIMRFHDFPVAFPMGFSNQCLNNQNFKNTLHHRAVPEESQKQPCTTGQNPKVKYFYQPKWLEPEWLQRSAVMRRGMGETV